MSKILTEELPSSGTVTCDHKWQIVEGGSSDPTKIMMVCSKAGCSATKLVEKPQLKESKGAKPVLFG